MPNNVFFGTPNVKNRIYAKNACECDGYRALQRSVIVRGAVDIGEACRAKTELCRPLSWPFSFKGIYLSRCGLAREMSQLPGGCRGSPLLQGGSGGSGSSPPAGSDYGLRADYIFARIIVLRIVITAPEFVNTAPGWFLKNNGDK